MTETDSERIARIDERTAHMAREQSYISRRLDDICEVQVNHTERIARQETRLGIFAGVFGGLSIILSGLGGFISHILGRA